MANELPELDIIIDDGGQTMEQQKITFELLFHKLKPGGLYLVEDTHTSYLEPYHGGYKRKTSFVEYAKNYIDSLYVHHLENNEPVRNDAIAQNILSVAFYDSIVVFEKGLRPKPFNKPIGKKSLSIYIDKTPKKKTFIG